MKLKFGLVGPSGCGKTLIANILGNEMSMDSSIGRPPYRPTNSVRIVEFSIPNIDIRKYTQEVDIQIWEIGGNPRLKSIWPGVQSNLDGIILVYDTNNELHVRDMSALHMHFVTHSNLNPAQCLIIGNQFRGNREIGPAKIVGVGPRVRHFVVNVDDDPNYLRDEFKHFLTGVAQFTLDQEKNPTNPNSFMARQESGEDLPVISRQMNYLEDQEKDDLQVHANAYYQPYADFHIARNSNRTRSRRGGPGPDRGHQDNFTGNYKGEEDDMMGMGGNAEFVNRTQPTPPAQVAFPRFRGVPSSAIAKDEFSIHKKSNKK